MVRLTLQSPTIQRCFIQVCQGNKILLLFCFCNALGLNTLGRFKEVPYFTERFVQGEELNLLEALIHLKTRFVATKVSLFSHTEHLRSVNKTKLSEIRNLQPSRKLATNHWQPLR